MGMLAVGINIQVVELPTPQAIFGKHAAHGVFDELGGIFLRHHTRGAKTLPARIARVMHQLFVVPFFPFQDDGGGVDDDHAIAHIRMGGEGRLVFAAQQIGDATGQTAQRNARRIYQIPLPLRRVFTDERRLIRQRIHVFGFVRSDALARGTRRKVAKNFRNGKTFTNRIQNPRKNLCLPARAFNFAKP